MNPEDTRFDYLFEVTEVPIVYLTGRLRSTAEAGHKALIGYAPVLAVEDYSPAPWKLFARIVLTPSDPRNALVAEASFSVDRGLIRCLHPGDVLILRGGVSAPLAMAVLREGTLVAAAGALCDVPLGADADVHLSSSPAPAAKGAGALTPGQDGACQDAVEVRIGNQRTVLYSGRPTLSGYDVFVRAARAGWPCISIERSGACPDTAAHTSAQLFDDPGLQIRYH
jgi:hypothetical protein